MLDALSNPEGQQDRVSTDALRKQIAEIERRLNAIAARIDKEFPDYSALAHPKPLKAEEVQKLLGADEALVFFLAGPNESYVFALTREGFEWRTISLGEKNMAAKVAAFRRGLDVEELTKSVSMGKAQLFDLAAAHELYVALLGPVEALIKDKPQLLIVPSGPLTALPFHLLVTDKPAIAVPQMQVNDMAAYRDAAWLVKRHAVTVLPSVPSLKALRVFARKGQGTKPMVGFGDPVFAPPKALPSRRPTATVKIAARTRAYSDYWRGASVDRAKLAEALSPLPESAEELKAVAAKLGASSSDIHLGRNATEANVKRLPLADYRVVYFATHGLVAGDVKGLGEPSLALTLPNEPSELDDGLLTASEVAQLKLNADWVVLSACNTAAGEKLGAEALSGLARAFFYAGARALLVSHWQIDSKAATRLTTSTFDIMRTQPDHRPRGGAAPCHARLSRRQVRYLEWLSGLLGLILTRRGRCGPLRRVCHWTEHRISAASRGSAHRGSILFRRERTCLRLRCTSAFSRDGVVVCGSRPEEWSPMKRREFITLSAARRRLRRPLAARAQPADKSRHIGALMMYAENDARGQSFVAAFRDELRKLGRAEGQSLRIDYRWSTSAPDAIERSVKELIALQPDLILSSSTPTTASLLRQTRTIPIIFANIVDPVGSGFVGEFWRGREATPRAS